MALRSKFMNENQLSRKRSAYSRESDGETESRPKPRTLRSPLSPLSSPTPSNTPLKSRSLYPASSPATRIFSAPHKSLPDSDSDSDSGIDLRRAQQTPTAKRRRGPTTRARSKTSNDDELADASYSSEDEDEEGAMRNDFDLVIETPVRKARVPLANRTTNNKTNARALPPTPPTVSVSPLTATAVYRPTLTACRQTLQTPPTPPSTPCSASSSSVSPSSPDTSPTPSSTSTSVRQPTKSISLPFHRSHRPPNLPCRDTERSTILDFLRASCVGPNAKPAGLYVCGVPGTGKTAVLGDCVAKVVDESEGNLLLVDVNCATLTDPKTVFVRALSEIRAATGRTEGWRAPRSGKDAQRELEAEVCRGGKRIILLLDEIDHLLPPPTSRSHADVDAANASSTAAGEALHGVFALPHLSGSRCVVVGIANALDLAERWMPRLRARGVAPSLVVFTPYTVPQITEILKERVNVAAAAMGIDVSGAGGAQPLFQSAAVELAARKTAGTGDLRKALDVCRQAIELAESEFRRAILNASSSPSPNTPATPTPTPALKVTLTHVLRASSSSLGTSNTSADRVRSLPLHGKLLLVAAVAASHARKQDPSRPPLTVGSLFAEYVERFASITPCLSRSEFVDLVELVAAGGVLGVSAGVKGKKKAAGQGDERIVGLEVGDADVEKGIDGCGLASKGWKFFQAGKTNE